VMHRKVLIAGAYGNGNLGDDAILLGILQTLSSKELRNNILVFSRDPEETISVHKVRASRRNIKDLLATDELIIGGGELFQDLGFMGFKYSVLGLFAKFAGKKLVFFAVGVSSIKSRVTKLIMRLCLNLSDEISVRDNASALRLRQIGVTRPVAVVDDPATNVKPVKPEEARRLLQLEQIEPSQQSILLGVVSQHVHDFDRNKRVQLFLLDFLRRALFQHPNLQVVFIPFSSHKDFNYDRDILYGKWLGTKLESRRYSVLRNHYTPQQMMGVLGQFDIVISTRFHPLVFARKMKVPAVGIRVFQKVENYCKTHNLRLLELDEDVELSDLLSSNARTRFSNYCAS
jgi:polysaccharide pyruvyl transferase CsaB